MGAQQKNNADEAYSKKLQKFYDILETPPATSGRFVVAGSTKAPKRSNISDELAREKKLKNDDTEQDIKLKKLTVDRLFLFLAGETIIIFAFAFLQATHLFGFRLEEWSFNLLTSVTIAQITAMLFVAVNYLFPKKTK
jgi:hypothetical protein